MISTIVNASRFLSSNQNSLTVARSPLLAIKSLYRYYQIQNNHKEPIHVTWEKPRIGWKKLNFDGSSKGNKGKSSIGGIFRDHNANFLLGYAESIGNTTSTMAEMAALRRGLELTLEQGWGDVWVEGDSKALVDAIIKRKNVRKVEEQTELSFIKEIILELDNFMVTHVYREGNRAADMLAKMGHCLEDPKVWRNLPPQEVLSIVHDDAQGKTILRNRR